MIRRLLLSYSLLLAGIVCIAQQPHAQFSNFPPGAFQQRAPLDAAPAAGCSQATTFLARTSSLTGNETTGYTNAICYWVNQSVYSNIDVAYIFATNNTTTAMLNLVSTSFTGTLTIGSGTFTADRGIAGDGSATDVATNFIPNTNSGNYNAFGSNQNVAFVGMYDRTSDTTGDASWDMGSSPIAVVGIRPLFSGNFTGFLNTASNFGTFDQVANGNTQGNYVYLRTGASSTLIRKNEAALGIGTGTSASSGLGSAQIKIFNESSSSFTTRQIAAIVIGGGLTTTAQMDAIAHGFNLYMTAVGANVY